MRIEAEFNVIPLIAASASCCPAHLAALEDPTARAASCLLQGETRAMHPTWNWGDEPTPNKSYGKLDDCPASMIVMCYVFFHIFLLETEPYYVENSTYSDI